ncbi:S26 family signal peptidase [Catellatospora bangladeshensis]|uniref:S26 family signal peptidase n=1 Tax=Catellatospora bangladeshensis TaxID=310355 RepID=UPI001944ED94
MSSAAVTSAPTTAPVTAAGPDPRRRHRGRGTAGAGHFVLLGDNLDESVDSRLFGPVPGHRIVGRARPLR